MNTVLRKSYKLDDYDNFIIAALFCLMVMFLYRFIDDKYESPFASHREKIAQLLNSKNIIKRKFNGQTSWFDVRGGQELFVNDYVYSYEESEAQILFENKDQINISPNTLFQLKKINNQIEMNLSSGSFVANFSNDIKETQLTVNIQGKKIILKPLTESRIIVGVGENGAEITVAKGSLDLDGREINTSQKVMIAEQKSSWVIQNLNLQTELPLESAKFYFDNSQDILFRLADKRIGKFQIIVSRDVAFKDFFTRKEFGSSVVSLNFIDDGTYYWKINEFDNEKNIIAESLPRSFSAIKKSIPKWVKLEDERYQVLEIEGKSILLDWHEVNSSLFDIEMVHDGNVELFTSNKNSFEFSPKTGGKYTFRIRARYNEHFSDWSVEKPIHVTYLQTPTIPEFIDYPSADALYYLHPNYPVQIRFTWHLLQGLYYQFQLKEDEVIKFDKEIKQNSLEYTLTKSANLKWRLRSVHSIGLYGPWTTWLESNITIHNQKSNWLPEEGSEVLLSRPEQITQFQWQDNGEEVEFELSKDESFQKIIHSKKLFDSQIEIPIAEIGTYYWRTRYLNSKGQTMYSPPIRVKFKPTPVPDKPEIDSEILIKIKKKAKRTSLIRTMFDFVFPESYAEEETKVKIKLPKNKQAKIYHVEIYKNENTNDLIFSTESKSEMINWEQGSEGTYYIRYSIIDYWGQEGPFSNFSKLKVLFDLELSTEKKVESKVKVSDSKIVKQENQNGKNNKDAILIPSTFFKRKDAQMAIGFSPTIFSFEETHATHTANYDGIAWQSVQIYAHKFFSNFEIDGRIHYSKGKVFTNQDFIYMQGSLSLLYNWENNKSIKPEAGLSLENYNFYIYQSATSVVAEKKSFSGIFLGAMFSFQLPITIHANYTIGESSGLSASWQYHYGNWLPEFSYRQRSYSKSSDEVSFSSAGLGLSYVYNW